jgi:hypothetical protein
VTIAILTVSKRRPQRGHGNSLELVHHALLGWEEDGAGKTGFRQSVSAAGAEIYT